MCVKIAAMERTLPGGLALQAVGPKMVDKNLVHAFIGCEYLDRGSIELRVNLILMCGHGSILLDL
jgi:hypothetical protein